MSSLTLQQPKLYPEAAHIQLRAFAARLIGQFEAAARSFPERRPHYVRLRV